MLKLYKNNSYQAGTETGVGANSLDLSDNNFVVKAAGVVSKAVAGGVISGVNLTQDTFESDNQTVDFATVEFYPETLTGRIYEVDVDTAVIAATDEGKYYDLSDSVTVDGSTSATGGQVELVEFISTTKGAFRIVNL